MSKDFCFVGVLQALQLLQALQGFATRRNMEYLCTDKTNVKLLIY